MKLRTPTATAAFMITSTLALLLSACGQGGDETAAIESTSDETNAAAVTTDEEGAGEETQGTSSTTALVIDGSDSAPAVFANTVGEYCSGSGDSRIEMAFAATVAERSTRQTYVNVDAEDDSGQSTRDVAWVTFTVNTWYTDDLGGEIGLWAPDFAGQVGERWLIAASRYSVGDKPGGDVYWCASNVETDELAAEWSEQYGGGVASGETTTEATPAPEILADIAEARALWDATAPTSYTVALSVGNRTTDGSACGAGVVRIVVADGAVVQARDVSRHCDVALDAAPTVDGLFDLAVTAAGAVEGQISFDPTYGFINDFYASDRSIEQWVNVSTFIPEAFPLATNGAAALSEARTRWQDAAITNYTATIDVRCFCDVQGPIDVTVEQGLVTAVSVEASEDYPLRVEEMFDAIEPLLSGDHAELAFHPQFGYPVTAILDPVQNGDDDEVEYAITAFAPLP